MPRRRKKDTAPSPANLFIAQDIRPRGLSDRRWKAPMNRLAQRAASVVFPGPWWGAGRIDGLQTARAVFVWLRSGR